MKVLIVGLGRSGTVSLTKWFNELFEQNNINAEAAHEYLSRESYFAYDEYYRTGNKELLNTAAQKLCSSNYDVIIGNGYAPLLPYVAHINKDIILIHLQRQNREAWISSSVKNAQLYPFAYKYFVAPELLKKENVNIPRTTAFHMGVMTIDEWDSWDIVKKLSWHYDFIHETINNHCNLFNKTLHIYTEDLNNIPTLSELAKFTYPEILNVPKAAKLNAHSFISIDDFPPELRSYAQWLLGNIDWQQAIANPVYFVTYAMNRFETWIGWCQTDMADKICPANKFNESEIMNLLKETLPKLERSLGILKAVLHNLDSQGKDQNNSAWKRIKNVFSAPIS